MSNDTQSASQQGGGMGDRDVNCDDEAGDKFNVTYCVDHETPRIKEAQPQNIPHANEIRN